VMTGIGIGMALGAFVAGWVVDTFGAQNGFWVSIISGAIALATVLIGQGTLTGQKEKPLSGAAPQPAE
jgi:predicted MFS family arabinose efflux permease